jgi:ribosome-binding protein aMBF1 (putative translation factor)
MNTSAQDASEILRRRYVGGDPSREAAIAQERFQAEVAQVIYDRRIGAGLTREELAERIGASASAIRRIEDADHDADSLWVARRILDVVRDPASPPGSGPAAS